MALIDQVTASYSNARLVEITNPDEPSFTTINTTMLQKFCDQIEGWLDGLSVGIYSDDDAAIVALAVEGVEAWARRNISPAEAERWDKWKEDARYVSGARRRGYITASNPSEATGRRRDWANDRMWTDERPAKPYPGRRHNTNETGTSGGG